MLQRLVLAVLMAAIFMPNAHADKGRAWLMQFNNSDGFPCIGKGIQTCQYACHTRDVVQVDHTDANEARIGGVMFAPFEGGPVLVTINAIHSTRDKTGRVFVTRSGCLFRWYGG